MIDEGEARYDMILIKGSIAQRNESMISFLGDRRVGDFSNFLFSLNLYNLKSFISESSLFSQV